MVKLLGRGVSDLCVATVSYTKTLTSNCLKIHQLLIVPICTVEFIYLSYQPSYPTIILKASGFEIFEEFGTILATLELFGTYTYNLNFRVLKFGKFSVQRYVFRAFQFSTMSGSIITYSFLAFDRLDFSFTTFGAFNFGKITSRV